MSEVSLREKVGYSLGDVGANLMFQVLAIFQLKFYTDVFGLPGAMASSILLIAPIITGVLVDPAAGLVTDRTHTRWGNYRPWLLWTALPFCVFYVLAFYNPGITDKALVAVYATISFVLLMATFSFNNIAYSSLGGVMTGNIKARASVNSVRFIATTITQFAVQGLTLPLVGKFGHGSQAHGWAVTISLFAIVALVCFIITFLSTRERIAPPPQQEMDVRRDIRQTVTDRSWRAMFALIFLAFVTLSMWGNSLTFFFQYCVDQHSLMGFLGGLGLVAHDGAANGVAQVALDKLNLLAHDDGDAYSIGFSLFNMVAAIVQFLGIITLSNFLANKLGKKLTFIVCMSLAAILTAMFYLPGVHDVRLIFILGVLRFLVYAPVVPLVWVMVADVADHIEYVHNRRATGFCFSGMVLALKIGLGVGGALVGVMLSTFGYVPGEHVPQTVSAVHGIRLASSVVPAMALLLCVVALLFYPIGKKLNEKIATELAERRRQVK